MNSFNKYSLNNNISEMFDQAMSDNLNKNININNKNIDKDKDKDKNKNIDKNIDKNKNINKDKNKDINKDIDKDINKDINIDNNIDKDINKKQYKFYDNTKKALLSSFIYLILSVPYLNIFFYKLIPNNNNTYNIFKIIFLKTFIFCILFMSIAIYI